MNDPLFDPLPEVLAAIEKEAAAFGNGADPGVPIGDATLTRLSPQVDEALAALTGLAETVATAPPPTPVVPATPPAPLVPPTAPATVPPKPGTVSDPFPTLPPPVPTESRESGSMQSVLAQVRVALDRITEAATHDNLADVRDGLAGLRTDLRVLPDQVNKAIAAGVLHAVSVALTDVRRPLEAVGLITEQLGALLGRMDTFTGLRGQVSKLEGLPAAIVETSAQLSGALGAISSDLAALITRITGMDARVATSSAALEPVRIGITEIERRLGQVDSTVAELRRLAAANGLNLEAVGATVREAVHASVRDHLRDALRDVVHDAVQDAIGDVLADAVRKQMAEAVETSARDSERRMVAHLDDAVLMLAEILLRRQVTGSITLPDSMASALASAGATKSGPAKGTEKATDTATDKATLKATDPPVAPTG